MTDFDEEMLRLRQHYSPSHADRARVRDAVGVALATGLASGTVLAKAGAAGTSQTPPAATVLGASGSSAAGAVVQSAALQSALAMKVIVGVGASTVALATAFGVRGWVDVSEAVQQPAPHVVESSSAPRLAPARSLAGQLRRDEPSDEAVSSTPPPSLGADGSSARPRRFSSIGSDGTASGSPRRPRRVAAFAAQAASGREGRPTAVPAAAGQDPDPSGKSSPPAAKATSAKGTIGEETRLLARASSALREGDQRKAERVLQLHALDFEDGSLAPEREGLRLLSRCQRQRSPALESEVSAFIQAFPTSPLRKHLRASCFEPTTDESTPQSRSPGTLTPGQRAETGR